MKHLFIGKIKNICNLINNYLIYAQLNKKYKGVNKMKIERFSNKGFMVYLTQNSNLINRVEQRGDILKRYSYYAGKSKGKPCTAKKYRDDCLTFINEVNNALI